MDTKHGMVPANEQDDDCQQPMCKCGSDMEWEDCDLCGGDGIREYMDAPDEWGEDCPSEVNHLITCSECGGAGGWWYCTAAALEAARPDAAKPLAGRGEGE